MGVCMSCEGKDIDYEYHFSFTVNKEITHFGKKYQREHCWMPEKLIHEQIRHELINVRLMKKKF